MNLKFKILLVTTFLSLTLLCKPDTLGERQIDLNNQSILKVLTNKIISNSSSDSINSALTIQLLEYKAKEDYIASALEEQSNRFVLIVTGLLALASLVSWKFFTYKISESAKKYAEINKQFEEFKQSVDQSSLKLLLTSANACALISHSARNAYQWHTAIAFGTASATESLRHNQLKYKNVKCPEDENEQIIHNLDLAIKDLTSLKMTHTLKKELDKEKNYIFDNLQHLLASGVDPIVSLATQLRLNIEEYIRE